MIVSTGRRGVAGTLIAERGVRLPKRDATLLLKGVGDRVNTPRARSASLTSRVVRKAGKPAVDIARQFVAGPAFAMLPCPVRSRAAHSAVGHLIPLLALLTG
jgi:hypothetical protein